MSQSQIIFGFHPIISQLRQSSRSIQEIYLDSDRNDPRAKEIIELAKENNIRILMVDRARLDGIASQSKHQGVVAKIIPLVIPYKTVEDILEGDLKEPAFFLILDGVEDPHNLGACLRVADGMGVHAVIAPKDRAVGLNATVRKVASGAAESVPFIVVTNYPFRISRENMCCVLMIRGSGSPLRLMVVIIGGLLLSNRHIASLADRLMM